VSDFPGYSNTTKTSKQKKWGKCWISVEDTRKNEENMLQNDGCEAFWVETQAFGPCYRLCRGSRLD
jgi:hypothetical protein